MLSSENNILNQTSENLNDFLPKDSENSTLTKRLKTNIGWLCCKLRTISSVECTAGSRWPWSSELQIPLSRLKT